MSNLPSDVHAGFVAQIQNEIDCPINRKKSGGYSLWNPDRFEIMHELRMHLPKLGKALVLDDRRAIREHAADLALTCMKAYELFGEEPPTK